VQSTTKFDLKFVSLTPNRYVTWVSIGWRKWPLYGHRRNTFAGAMAVNGFDHNIL